jgi:putative SOS response-associated peptidase YedK
MWRASEIKLPVVLPKAALNLEPRDDIWPTDVAPVIRRAEGGVELAQMRFGFPPGRPEAGPVINFRSPRAGGSPEAGAGACLMLL